jgi:hypothetical protein
MLEIDLWRFEDRPDRVAELKSLINDAKTMAERSNREAVDFLMRGIGLYAQVTRNESYHGLALNYSLALVYAFLNEPAAAAEHIELSGILPFGGGEPIFSEAQRSGLDLAASQEASLARHVPCVFLASMPRAASAALTSTISEQFGCPAVRASIGRFPNYYLVPFWVRRLSRGGCVLHDHFRAEPFNRAVLSNCGIRTVFVLVRDPRAAAVSFAQFPFRGPVSEEHIMRVFDDFYVPWLRDWEEYAASSREVEVIWLRSADVTAGNAQLRTVMEKIVASLAKSAPDWRPPDLSKPSLADANFLTGTPDGWKSLVSKSGQEHMWSKVPVRFREMLELEP